jgi:heptosyltransferase II
MSNSLHKSIFVRAPNWIGDQILAFPFYHYLRKAYPCAHITSVCVSWVRDLQYMDLVDEVYVLPRPSGVSTTLMEKFSILEEGARQLRNRRRWDLGITLPNSFSAAWLLFRAGISKRRGYSVDGRGILLNDALSWSHSADHHRAQAYLDLLPAETRPDRLALEFWGELDQFNAAKSWPDACALEPPVEPYWVLAPGATAESRRWPIEYFVQLAQRIRDETGWLGLVVGGSSEAALSVQLCDDPRLKLRDLTGQCAVTELWRIFRNANVTVCNESGLAHVAALCGSPVQIICGAADPRRTRPLGPGRVQVAFNPVECWPCERNSCMQSPDLKIQCLRGINPETVWGEIKRGIRSS